MTRLYRRFPCSSGPKIFHAAYLRIDVFIFFNFLVDEATHYLNGEIHGAEDNNSTALMEFDCGDTGLESQIYESHLSRRPKILIFLEVADEGLFATGTDSKFLATWGPDSTKNRQFILGVGEFVALAALEWKSRNRDASVVRAGKDLVEAGPVKCTYRLSLFLEFTNLFPCIQQMIVL